MNDCELFQCSPKTDENTLNFIETRIMHCNFVRAVKKLSLCAMWIFIIFCQLLIFQIPPKLCSRLDTNDWKYALCCHMQFTQVSSNEPFANKFIMNSAEILSIGCI